MTLNPATIERIEAIRALASAPKVKAGIPAIEDCDLGFRPSEYNVVVAPEVMADKIGSVYIPDSAKETEELAKMRGRLVAASPAAFSYFDGWPEGAMPKAGDEVIFAKYAGTLIEGRDGREYRLCKDKDIAAVVLP